MINIKYLFSKRQSGKSTSAQLIYEKRRGRALLFSQNPELKSIGAISYGAQLFDVSTLNIDMLILDEYQFVNMRSKRAINDFIAHNQSITNIIILTTPKYQYKKEIVEQVRDYKKRGIPQYKIYKRILRSFQFPLPFMDREAFQSSIDFIFFDLITHPTALITVEEDYLRCPSNMFTKIDANYLYSHSLGELTGVFYI